MIKFRLCENKQVRAMVKVLLLFVLLVLIVFSVSYIEQGTLDFSKALLHAIKLVLKFCNFLIVIDYIRIKSKMKNRDTLSE